MQPSRFARIPPPVNGVAEAVLVIAKKAVASWLRRWVERMTKEKRSKTQEKTWEDESCFMGLLPSDGNAIRATVSNAEIRKVN